MSSVPTSEVLNRAADLIEERGWTKGNEGMLVSENSPLCLEGAIAAASGVTDHVERPTGLVYPYPAAEACPAYAAVRSFLADRVKYRLYCWNDDRKQASEVIEVLRAAAVIEAARENAANREQVPA